MNRVILLLVVMLMSVRPTFAATFTVTNTSNAGAGSLRKAVDDANLAAGADEIVFNTAGTFSVPRTITLDTPLEIRGSLTITAPTNVAQRVTIRGAATGTRLINVTVSGLGLTLRDLIFENAKVLTVGDAGGVLFAGPDIILTLIAERCIFQNNQAAQEGAALSLQVGVLTLTDCTFRNNTALFSAAIDFAESGDAAGFTTLTRCVFENNVSSRVGGSNGRFGSVITQENGNLAVVDCTFTNNTGELAAVYCGVFGGAGRFDVTDSIFEDNDGGCISAFSNSVTLTGCRFERNGTILRSSDGGGYGLVMTDCVGLNNTGLLLWPSGIVVEDCRFDDNGGGIVGNAELYRVKMRRNAGITEGTLIAEDCDFDSNTGGGFEVGLYNRLEMRRCAITRNVGTLENVPSTNSPPLVAHTPTLMVAGHITLESCTVSDNSGIVQAAEEAKFYNCTFSNNSVGITPLIYIGPTPPYSGLRPPVTLQNCVFSLNGNGTTKIIAANYRDNNGYAIKSLGGNFIDLTDFLSWGQAGIGPHATDQVVVTGNARLDAKLGPLLDWGGAGLSRMPLAGSPLTDAGNVAPAAPEYQEPIKDQTGRNRVRGVKVDIGAVETRSRLVVTNTNDSGAGSLREAVSLANGLPDAEIVFEDATFGTTPKTITLTSGQIIVLSSLTMTGPEIGVAISGGGSSRILSIIGSNGTYVCERINFNHGNATSDGGAVAMDAGTGAQLTLRNCIFNDNNSGARGGGVFINSGTLIATNCLWSANTAGTTGGGLAATAGATVLLTNTTLSGNSSLQGGGGALMNNSAATLIHCTVTANTADSDATDDGNGGGLRVNGTATPLQLGNTVVAGNADASAGTVNPDISGAFATLGHNFVGKTDGQTVAGVPVVNGVSGDQAGTIANPLAAQLAALADNGGLFRSHKPQTGSPLINGGDAALLSHSAWPESPIYDARIQFRDLGTAPDIGAVEAADGVYLRLFRDTDTVASEQPDDGTAAYVLQRSRPGTEVVAVLARVGTSTASVDDVQLSSPRMVLTNPGVWNLTIGADALSKRITLLAVNDTLQESSESFILALVINAVYAIDSSPANDRTVTILSNDGLVTSTNNSGAGSLRDTVQALASLRSAEIYFDPAVFNVPRTITLTSPINLDGGGLLIQGPNTQGAGVTIDGGNTSELFTVSGNITLRDLHLTRGFGRIIAPPEIGSTAISLNGGISLTLDRCCVSACRGNYYGGAISIYQYSRLIATNTTFARNETTGHGGAIYGFYDSNVDLTHCTLAENHADTDLSNDGRGGAIYMSGALVGTQTSVAGILTMKGCLVSMNTDSRAHVEVDRNSRARHIAIANAASFVSGGGNYFSSNFDQGGGPTDLIASLLNWVPNSALLMPLGNYGGPTPTYALCAGSPAANLVTQGFLTEDQRGMPRNGTATPAGAYGFAIESYDYWKSYAFPAGASLTGPNDDPDRDGAPNLVEQHAGTNPLSAAEIPSLIFSTSGGLGNIAFQVRYPISGRVALGSLFVEESNNLQSWTASPTIGTIFYECVGTQWFTYYSIPPSAAEKRFLRLRASNSEP